MNWRYWMNRRLIASDLAKRISIGIGALLGISLLYQNCSRPPSPDSHDPKDRTTSQTPTSMAKTLTYQQWNGTHRNIEFTINHQTKQLLAKITESDPPQASCNNFDSEAAYVEITNLLASVELHPASPDVVCTAVMRDSVDLKFDDSARLHFGFSNCDEIASHDRRLQDLVMRLCPPVQ